MAGDCVVRTATATSVAVIGMMACRLLAASIPHNASGKRCYAATICGETPADRWDAMTPNLVSWSIGNASGALFGSTSAGLTAISSA